ncbi:MAG TPA: ATP-grasp domain-containing protein [Nitrososphaerales archaeon]|nr:ATP-grasp domain-containing protein [Nitrososphaerales archaeon]
MRLFEYEGKELFSKYGIPVPRSKLANDESQVLAAVEEIGLPFVIKAQVLSGGRGKAGGVVLVRTKDEARREAGRVLALNVGGEPTRALLVEEAAQHGEEMYVSVSLNRGRREFVALASRSGGTEVESRAQGAVEELPVPLEGLRADAASALGTKLGLEGRTSSEFCSILLKLERLSREEECELAEINPLAVHADGTLIALDSKIVLDDNALFRHPEFSQLPPEDPLEGEAAKFGFAFVRLDGNVAVVGNGAGLVLSTLDLVADAGGRAACFLDLGGGAQRERVEAALRLVRGLPSARAILVNIFGGITRTTDVAEGLRAVVSERPMVPVFARISGAEEAEAHALLSDSGVPVFRTAQEAVLAAVRGVSP